LDDENYGIPRKKIFSKIGACFGGNVFFPQYLKPKTLLWKVKKICFDITKFGTYSLKRIRQLMQILKRQNSINDKCILKSYFKTEKLNWD
jgi:hypothetical protein